jgi:hypothetical protein
MLFSKTSETQQGNFRLLSQNCRVLTRQHTQTELAQHILGRFLVPIVNGPPGAGLWGA